LGNLHPAQAGCDTPQSLKLQLKELQQHPDAVAFWQENRATYSCLADTALDFIVAPASSCFRVNRPSLFVLEQKDNC